MAANDTRALTNGSLPGQVGARRSLQHVRTGNDFGLVWSGADSVERTAIETTNPPVCAWDPVFLLARQVSWRKASSHAAGLNWKDARLAATARLIWASHPQSPVLHRAPLVL